MLQEVTHVVHLAALNDYECRAEPEKAKLVNVEYTRRVVEQAGQLKTLRFIYLSTIQVYGNNLSGVISETSPTDPKDAYSQTHLDAEQIVEQAHNSQQLEVSDSGQPTVLVHQCHQMPKFGKLSPMTFVARRSRRKN